MVFVPAPVPIDIFPVKDLVPVLPVVWLFPILIVPVVVLFANVILVPTAEGWKIVPINPPLEVIVPEPLITKLLVTIFAKLVMKSLTLY